MPLNEKHHGKTILLCWTFVSNWTVVSAAYGYHVVPGSTYLKQTFVDELISS